MASRRRVPEIRETWLTCDKPAAFSGSAGLLARSRERTSEAIVNWNEVLVVVTGAAGFIGSDPLEELGRQGGAAGSGV